MGKPGATRLSAEVAFLNSVIFQTQASLRLTSLVSGYGPDSIGTLMKNFLTRKLPALRLTQDTVASSEATL